MVKNGVFEEIIFLFQYVIHMKGVYFLCRIGFFEVFFLAKLASLSSVYFNYIQKKRPDLDNQSASVLFVGDCCTVRTGAYLSKVTGCFIILLSQYRVFFYSLTFFCCICDVKTAFSILEVTGYLVI